MILFKLIKIPPSFHSLRGKQTVMLLPKVPRRKLCWAPSSFLGLFQTLMGSVGLFQILQGFVEPCRAVSGFIGSCWALSCPVSLCQALLGFVKS